MALLMQKLFGTRSARPVSELERWLCDLPRLPEFEARRLRLEERTEELRRITPVDEVATISLLVERLRPALCLEIGTFFASTSRVVVEALQAVGETGRLLTIDPYGGHRVPGILEGWPEELRRRVDFRPINSMTLFDDLDTNRIPKGGRSSLGLAFVDGNHNFEYALFDIIRSADFLAPGGVIVVDNMELEGPRHAVIRFLQWNAAWRLYAGGQLFGPGLSASDLTGVSWGVLISPRGVQIAQLPVKFLERSVSNQTVHAIKFNSIESLGQGALAVHFNYFACPYDYHLTGKGIVREFRSVSMSCQPGRVPVIEFESPAELVLPNHEYNVNYELEVLFTPKNGRAGYVLLDKDQPYTFE